MRRLAQPERVADDKGGYCVVKVQDQGQALALGHALEGGLHPPKGVIQTEGGLVQRDLAGFDLRIVQGVVQKLQQRASAL